MYVEQCLCYEEGLAFCKNSGGLWSIIGVLSELLFCTDEIFLVREWVNVWFMSADKLSELLCLCLSIEAIAMVLVSNLLNFLPISVP